jgi:hypothetical protein
MGGFGKVGHYSVSIFYTEVAKSFGYHLSANILIVKVIAWYRLIKPHILASSQH